MREIPAKVIYAASLEIGIFLGLGIMVFHTIRIMYTASKKHSWTGFKEL